MENCCSGRQLLFGIVFLVVGVPPARPQAASPATVPVQMLVTVEGRHGAEVPEITRDDVMVYQGRNRDRVTEWMALQEDRAGLELFVAIDGACSPSLAQQLDEIRRFINSQPAPLRSGWHTCGTARWTFCSN